MPRFPGFCGPTYPAISSLLDSQRCINLYPEVADREQGAGGPSPISLIPTPGLQNLSPDRVIGTGPVRALWAEGKSRAFAVADNTFYEITTGTTVFAPGVGTDGLPASIASNGTQLMIAAQGGTSFIFDLAANTITQITDVDFAGARAVAFLDGYFIALKPNARTFQISALNNGLAWDGLDVATVEGETDQVEMLIQDHKTIWFFGRRAAIAYYDSGNADFPIVPISGGVVQIGVLAPSSVARGHAGVFWLGGDRDRGTGQVWRLQGLQADKVSNAAIEARIQGASGVIDDAIGWCMNYKGHELYVLVFPTAADGLVYDASTNLWHEWRYWDGSAFKAPIARCHAAGYADRPIHIVGSRFTTGAHAGKVYELTDAAFTDGVDAIRRERTAAHIADELKPTFHWAFHLDVDTTATSGASSTLQWSDDGGKTFNAGIAQTVSGERVSWRRLGRAARDRVYRWFSTAAVRWIIRDAYLEIDQGAPVPQEPRGQSNA